MKVAVVLATLVVLASSSDSFPRAGSETILNDFIAGNQKFTARLFQESLEASNHKNLLLSPFSIQLMLGLAQQGASGKTATEISTALNLPLNDSITQSTLASFDMTLSHAMDQVEFYNGNKMILSKNLPIKLAFELRFPKILFNLSMDSVDFSEKEKVANSINQWAEEQTHNKIHNIVSPDLFNSLTKMVLVSTFYFRGHWDFPFTLTNKEKFYNTPSETSMVDMMRFKSPNSLKYYECKERNAEYLELPYSEAEFKLTIVLPKEVDGLAALEADIEGLLKENKLNMRNVDVALPKFATESDIELKPILQKLGLKSAFTDEAEFSKISEKAIKLDEVIQKTFFNVAEAGTEVAASFSSKENWMVLI